MPNTDYSQTYVGRDIFAAIWALSILAALSNSCKITLPFDKDYMSFVENKRKAISKILDLVASFTGLSKQVMDLAESEAPWNFVPKKNYNYYDADSLNAELSITSGTRGYTEYNYDDMDNLRLGLERSINAQLVKLFDTLLQGRFCFNSDKECSCSLLIIDIFAEVEILLGECVQPNKNFLLTNIFSKWRKEHEVSENVNSDDMYIKWVGEKAKEIANSIR